MNQMNWLRIKNWKSNQKIVMNEEMVQNGVMNEQFVKNIVMNAKIDPFRIGGWKCPIETCSAISGGKAQSDAEISKTETC